MSLVASGCMQRSNDLKMSYYSLNKLVAKVYAHREGIDYNEVFSLVVK